MRSAALALTLGLATALAACGDDKTKSTASTCVKPPAAPAPGTMPACQATMFSKYTGAGFDAVTQNVIDIAVTDAIVPKIGDTFQTKIVSATPARQAEFKTNLAAFLKVAYGATATDATYAGPTMVAAHTGLQITSAQYDAFVTDVVVPALQKAGVPSDDLTNCFAPQVTDPAFKYSMVECE